MSYIMISLLVLGCLVIFYLLVWYLNCDTVDYLNGVVTTKGTVKKKSWNSVIFNDTVYSKLIHTRKTSTKLTFSGRIDGGQEFNNLELTKKQIRFPGSKETHDVLALPSCASKLLTRDETNHIFPLEDIRIFDGLVVESGDHRTIFSHVPPSAIQMTVVTPNGDILDRDIYHVISFKRHSIDTLSLMGTVGEKEVIMYITPTHFWAQGVSKKSTWKGGDRVTILKMLSQI